LIERTGDSFGLKLKTGSQTALQGTFDNGARRFHLKLSFNRTFVRSELSSTRSESNYPAAGSWTRRMRPDYTLTLWPATFTEDEAERQELISHIHFDAKYRVETISELFGGDSENDLDEPDEAKDGSRTAKRSDLLKMHSYRDAIRRSLGAYVLYPGDELVRWRGFHEILPGLGAFPIAPGSGEGIDALSQFLDDVIDELSDRTSQLERNSFHVYQSHASSPFPFRMMSLPERQLDNSRSIPPDEQVILAVRLSNAQEIAEVSNRLTLVIQLLEQPALLRSISDVRYVFLYSLGFSGARLLGIKKGPLLRSGEQILAEGFTPLTLDGIYMVYELEQPPQEFAAWKWTPEELVGIGMTDSAPQVKPLTLADIVRTSAT